MTTATERITPAPEPNTKREAVFRAALERVRSMRTAGNFRSWMDRELAHELYRVPASAVRDGPVGELVPSALIPFVLQYFLPLVTEGADLFPEEVRVGTNLLNSTSPLQGILSPATVRGTAPSGEPRRVAGVLLFPGLVSIPAHVSQVEGAAEVLVYFGASSLTVAFYDAPADAIAFDLVR